MPSSGGVPPRRASWLEDSLHTPPPRLRTVEAVGLKRERLAGYERSRPVVLERGRNHSVHSDEIGMAARWVSKGMMSGPEWSTMPRRKLLPVAAWRAWRPLGDGTPGKVQRNGLDSEEVGVG